MTFIIRGLKLINHPHPLILVGSDVLSGGRPSHEWNYVGTTLETSQVGVVEGSLRFKRNGCVTEMPLLNVPSATGRHANGASTLALVAPCPPSAEGQYLRRFFA